MSNLHWVALATAARVGGKTFTNLIAHFGSLENVLEASQSDLLRVPRIGRKTAAAIAQIDLAQIAHDITEFESTGGHIITWEDATYPPHLLQCDNAPPVLFVKGSIPDDAAQMVAIVGTRQPRPDNRQLAHDMAYELAIRGWVIVSGLAIGIDTAAHNGALKAGGQTLAILGSGVLNVYPQRNQDLGSQIMKNGALIAEVHPQASVSPQQLIARNRIQSGLSHAVIIIESGINGGSMSTARRAVEQGRTLFAVIGGGSGCAQLLEDGALAIDPCHMDWDQLAENFQQIYLNSQPSTT